MAPEVVAFGVVLLVLAAAAALIRVVEAGQRLVVRRGEEVVRTSGSGLAFVVPLLETAQRVDLESHHRWTVASATTADGVSARLHVEFTITVTDPASAPADADAQVLDAVEDAVRRRVRSRTVAALPGAGDAAPWLPESPVLGVRLGHGVVASADVQVTGELRRLVSPAPR